MSANLSPRPAVPELDGIAAGRYDDERPQMPTAFSWRKEDGEEGLATRHLVVGCSETWPDARGR